MRQITFAILVGLLTACTGNLPASSPQAPQSTEAANLNSALPSATPITLVADLVPITTYTDTHLGFAFDYPADWTISALPDVPYAAVTIHSWDPEDLTGPRSQGEGLPQGGEKMDILPQANYGPDFREALPWFREGNTDRKFTEEDVTLPNGMPGILIRFEDISGELMVRCLLTAVKETTILLCGSAENLQFFEPIAFSLRESGQ